jgi:hypothetical protein
VLSLFCMCDDVIFLSDDGRRRRRLHHSRCSSLALFFPILSFLFRLLFLDAHLVVTEFVNKLIHRILRHAHLSIIRNDHSINTTLATNQPSIINANRFLCDEGLFLNVKLHVPSLTSTTAEILMS